MQNKPGNFELSERIEIALGVTTRKSLNVEDGKTSLFTYFPVLVSDHLAKWQKVLSGVNISTSQYECLLQRFHCVKSVQIRSFFWSEYRKKRTRKNFIFGHFSRSGCNKKTDRIQEKSLRLIINDYESSLYNTLFILIIW